MNAVVSRAEEGDLRDLTALAVEYFTEKAAHAGLAGFECDRDGIAAELEEFLGHSDYGAFIARSPKGHPLGFCAVFPFEVQLRQEPFSILERLYVREAFRRRGVGTQLVNEAKRFARSEKTRKLQMTLSAFYTVEGLTDFLKANRFYETGGRRHKIAL